MSNREISQSDFSKTTGISRVTISKASQSSSGKDYSMKFNTALAITQALDVNFLSLFSRLNSEEIKKLDRYVDEKYLKIFQQNVKSHLMKNGKTQKFLSSEGGVKESTISEILNKETFNPYLSSLISISEMLDVDIIKLFTRGEIKK